MLIYEPRESKGADGNGTGRFRLIERSDEDRLLFRELCNCPNGHSSAEAARACTWIPETRIEKRPLTKNEAHVLRSWAGKIERDGSITISSEIAMRLLYDIATKIEKTVERAN